MPKPKKRERGQLGCWFLLLNGIVLIAMFSANVLFVRVFFGTNLTKIDDRVFGAAQFVLPIIMIAIEFWIFDQAVSRRKMPKDDHDSE